MNKDEAAIVDQFLDESATVRAGRNTVAEGQTQQQIDRERRIERQFLAGFAKALNDRLLGSGLWCTRIEPAYNGAGYGIICTDAEKRPYGVTLTFDEWLDKVERVGGDAGRQMIGVVAERIVAARREWFRRMGAAA